MPKYFDFKVCGYYLYFTNKCIIECMHVHASDKRLSEAGSAKFIVKGNGDTELMKQGTLNDLDVRKIQGFIKEHYVECMTCGQHGVIMDIIGESNNMPLIWEMAREKELGVAVPFLP